MKSVYCLATLMTLIISGCSSLKPATVTKNGEIRSYKFIYISPTNSLTSSSGASVSGQYFSSSKTVNPTDVITGILTKEDFIRLPELKQDFTDQTLIVNYGESGGRNK